MSRTLCCVLQPVRHEVGESHGRDVPSQLNSYALRIGLLRAADTVLIYSKSWMTRIA